MPSYIVTGAARGLGYEFLLEISSDPRNAVIGLVRNKAATDERLAMESKTVPNLHILQADVTDYNDLKRAVEDTAKITGGSLDYIIANAGIQSKFDAFEDITIFAEHPEWFEESLKECFDVNVTGNVHLLNLFMPLILKGEAKKIVVISSGMADTDFCGKYGISLGPSYAISKSAVNAVVAKFSAIYAKQGVLLMSICPGFVDTGNYGALTEKQLSKVGEMVEAFKRYAPNFAGPSTPTQAVKDVLAVAYKSSVANGDGGQFLSHFGTKRWL